MKEIPRRIRLDQHTPAESAITQAMAAVEMAGCDPLLTDAVVLLGQARDKVADFVDAGLQVKQSPVNEALNFLRRAASENARIVSTGDLHEIVIAEASAHGRMYVDPETGLGWVLMPWDISTVKDREREKAFSARNAKAA